MSNNSQQTIKSENKQRVVIWLTPSMISRIDGWLQEDNCRNRTEFAENALRFYMGYLATEDTSAYLSQALVCTLRGIIEDNANRFRSLIFKLCVEISMATHVVSAHFKADPINLRELRGMVVDEVKRTNGQVRFDDALHHQRMNVEPWDE